MLTSDEKDRVRTLVHELTGARDRPESSLMAFMAALPARPEALDLARETLTAAQAHATVAELDALVVRLREILSAPAAATAPQSSLEMLLANPGPHAAKVDALLALVRASDRTAVPVIKARIPLEADPFVLATLASVLGQLGERVDAPVLLPLLDSRDARVVANALDALNRMEAEAPVEQVRDLIHAADHRLRLSALALFARTDPVNALLALPPLIGENHPTLTGGIALLLGDLGNQPLATDLLLDLLADEERPHILRHITEALKRHADAAPERVPEITRRLLEARAGSPAHTVPVLTSALQALGVTELPPVAAPPTPPPPVGKLSAQVTAPMPRPDGLEPPPVASQSRIQPRPAVPAGAYQSGIWTKGSGTIQRPADLQPPQPADQDEPEAPGGKPWMWAGGAVVVLAGLFALTGGPSTGRTSAHAPTASSGVGTAVHRPAEPAHATQPTLPRTPAARTASTQLGDGPLGRPPARTLGAAGVELTIDGTVVSIASNRVVVRMGQVFYSCRGKGLAELKVGDPVKLAGRLAGVARDGMVLVTVGSA